MVSKGRDAARRYMCGFKRPKRNHNPYHKRHYWILVLKWEQPSHQDYPTLAVSYQRLSNSALIGFATRGR